MAACPRSFFRPTASPRVHELREHLVERKLLRSGQGEARVVRVALDVVEVDRVESGLHALGDARGDERAEHVDRPDVEPPLPRPAVRLPADARRVTRRVGAPALPRARVDVADRVRVPRVDPRHRRLRWAGCRRCCRGRSPRRRGVRTCHHSRAWPSPASRRSTSRPCPAAGTASAARASGPTSLLRWRSSRPWRAPQLPRRA